MLKLGIYRNINKLLEEVEKLLKYEVVIIGGGSSGVEAALYARSLGMKVAIIEKFRWGGRKVHAGLFKAKQLQKCANVALSLREASSSGFDISSFEVDYSRLQNKMFSNAMKHASRIYSELITAGVDCYAGEASVDVNQIIRIENQAMRAENIILATGSKEKIPDLDGLSKKDFLTIDQLYELNELPHEVTIIGGGLTAAETALSLAPLGTIVTILENDKDLMLQEDAEVRYMMKKQLAALNVTMLPNQKNMRATNGKVMLDDIPIHHEHLLIACGTVGNFEIARDLQVEIANTYIKVNQNNQTTEDNIYAIGSVTKSSQSAAKKVIHHILQTTIPYKPQIEVMRIHSTPPILTVGMNENELHEQVDVFKGTVEMLSEEVSFEWCKSMVKILIDQEFGEILGAVIIGENANEIMTKLVKLIQSEGTIEDFHQMIPSISVDQPKRNKIV